MSARLRALKRDLTAPPAVTRLGKGLCACGKVRYASRAGARKASRLAVPGKRMRVHEHDGCWHVTSGRDRRDGAR